MRGINSIHQLCLARLTWENWFLAYTFTAKYGFSVLKFLLVCDNLTLTRDFLPQEYCGVPAGYGDCDPLLPARV